MKKITKELITSFKNHLIEEEKSENTIEKYIHDVTMFKKWLCNFEVTKTAVLNYKKMLCEKYAPASVNAALSSLNSFFTYNNWYNLKVKTLKIQRRIFVSKDKELSKSEYQRLLTAAQKNKNTRLYYLMQTICSCGIRVSELKSITYNSVLNGKTTINCKGKTRIIILPKQLCKMLIAYAKSQNITQGPIFVTKTGKPMDRSNIWKMLKNICKIAGVEKDKVFPHNFRHLFARTYYSMQKDIVRLADILGHSNVNTTRIYTIENGDVHRKQLQKLGLLRY
ncbi:MAG: tyrosine-type recombinase/integrase [Clostridia bacterium]|nr:tyrosine-type recombinase/integrase [Clostridia bacterium]